MYKCCNCNGTGEVGESPDGANWYAAACPVCKGAGETQRFVRAPDCDKRLANGDDFAGDAWLDQKTRQIVYGAVGHDRNAAANASLHSPEWSAAERRSK
jgi:hypothetical protein